MTPRPSGAPRPPALVTLALVTLAALASSCGSRRSDGDARGTCLPEVHAWAERCSAQGARVAASQCPAPSLVVVSVEGLRVELTREPGRGFRRAGPWGVSPVGEFADWSAVDARLRRGFDQVLACAADPRLPARVMNPSAAAPRRPAPAPRPTPSTARPPTAPPAPAPPPAPPPAPDAQPFRARPPAPWQLVPWALLGALACAVAASSRPRSLRPWLLPGALALAALALRAALAPAAFLHQNGHGPAWIAHTVTGSYHPYGAGFRELFGAVIRLAPDRPERAVFALQSALGALAVACAYALARRAGGGRPIAAAAALVVAAEPALARACQSESYYATQGSLYLVAAALLAQLTAGRPLRSRGFALACAASGLALAQALRVHPVGWVAGGLVPLVLLAAPGSLRRRLARTAAAFALVGAVAALAALPGVVEVARSDLGARWMPRATPPLAAVLRGALPVAFVVALAASSQRRRALPRALAAVLVVVAMGAADVVSPTGSRAWITAAYAWLYAPALVALGASLAAGLARDRRAVRLVAAAVALAGALSAASRTRALTKLPTDALELRRAVAWRDTKLPAGARVAHLERAGDHILTLPIYPGLTRRGHGVAPLRWDEPAPPLTSLGTAVYWYRASTCSTRAGAPWCEAVERAHRLEPVWTAELPAVASMAHLPYASAPVRVGLYRVLGEAAVTP